MVKRPRNVSVPPAGSYRSGSPPGHRARVGTTSLCANRRRNIIDAADLNIVLLLASGGGGGAGSGRDLASWSLNSVRLKDPRRGSPRRCPRYARTTPAHPSEAMRSIQRLKPDRGPPSCFPINRVLAGRPGSIAGRSAIGATHGIRRRLVGLLRRLDPLHRAIVNRRDGRLGRAVAGLRVAGIVPETTPREERRSSPPAVLSDRRHALDKQPRPRPHRLRHRRAVSLA